MSFEILVKMFKFFKNCCLTLLPQKVDRSSFWRAVGSRPLATPCKNRDRSFGANLIENAIIARALCSKVLVFCLTISPIVFGFVAAQVLGYTVQVIALSDEQRALQMQTDLAAQGHAAYLLTVPTEQGTIYRLRVGAFANRDAAAQYAAIMPSLGDSEPGPALAESIPQNLIPLVPELMGRYKTAETSLKVLDWPTNLALRTQSTQTLQEATYTVLGGPSFAAWRAFPGPDGTFIRIHSLSLWSPSYASSSEAEREAYADKVVGELATELNLSPEQVSSFTFAAEPPFLVVAEQLNPQTGEQKRLPALGQPRDGLTADGPELQWFGGEGPSLSEPSVLFDLERLGESQAATLLESWQVVAEGEYTRLESLDGQKSWRAVAGRPLWAGADSLVAQDAQDVLVYRFLTR